MGAWGAGNFDNDDAIDWADTLVSAGRDSSVVEAALRAVANVPVDQYVEAPESSCALAAAEVVAGSNGHPPSSGFPDEAEGLDDWVNTYGSLLEGPQLLDLALRAVERVTADSELRELWDEAGADEWDAAVADLRLRLGMAASQ